MLDCLRHNLQSQGVQASKLQLVQPSKHLYRRLHWAPNPNALHSILVEGLYLPSSVQVRLGLRNWNAAAAAAAPAAAGVLSSAVRFQEVAMHVFEQG